MTQDKSKKMTIDDVARLFEEPKIHTAELWDILLIITNFCKSR